MKSVNKDLAGRRQRLGLTQDELAKRAGVGVATIRRIETHQQDAIGKPVQRLCQALELDIVLIPKMKKP